MSNKYNNSRRKFLVKTLSSLVIIYTIPNLINNLSENSQNFNKQINQIRRKTVYHIGESARIGSDYIEELNNKLNS